MVDKVEKYRLGINQIDHVLVNSRFANIVLDAKSARGADCDTDILVVDKLKVTLKKTRSSKKIGLKGRFYIQKLDEPNIRDIYLSRIDRKIRPRPVEWENKGIEEIMKL